MLWIRRKQRKAYVPGGRRERWSHSILWFSFPFWMCVCVESVACLTPYPQNSCSYCCPDLSLVKESLDEERRERLGVTTERGESLGGCGHAHKTYLLARIPRYVFIFLSFIFNLVQKFGFGATLSFHIRSRKNRPINFILIISFFQSTVYFYFSLNSFIISKSPSFTASP